MQAALPWWFLAWIALITVVTAANAAFAVFLIQFLLRPAIEGIKLGQKLMKANEEDGPV